MRKGALLRRPVSQSLPSLFWGPYSWQDSLLLLQGSPEGPTHHHQRPPHWRPSPCVCSGKRLPAQGEALRLQSPAWERGLKPEGLGVRPSCLMSGNNGGQRGKCHFLNFLTSSDNFLSFCFFLRVCGEDGWGGDRFPWCFALGHSSGVSLCS